MILCHLINDPHLDKTCCCVGRGACVYLWCRLMILSNEHQHPHTWSPPGAPMLGNTQYRVASIMGRKIVSKIGGEQENRDPMSAWEIECGMIWAKIAPKRHRRNKTRQATYNCPGWEGRTFLSQPNPVTTFPPTHCARLFRSGIGYTLWGTRVKKSNHHPDRFIHTSNWWNPFHYIITFPSPW